MSERDCIHGQLARSCGLCERDATIAALQEEIRTHLKWRDALSGMVVIPVAHLDALEAEVERYKAIALLRGWLLEPPSGETNLPKINVNGDARDLDVDLNANCWTALDVGEHSAAILIVTKFSDVCGGGPTKYGQAIIHQLTGMSGERSAP